MPFALTLGTALPRRHTVAFLVAVLVAVVLATTACPGNVAHTYKSFQSAVGRGASCSELFDQRARFHNDDTHARIDRDLDRIGCTSREATRTDR